MTPQANTKVAFLLLGSLFLVSSALLFWHLQTFPFTDYDEAIYAQVITDTAHQHSFLTLYGTEGAPWFHKPPLYFWLAMEADQVLHHPELSYRLPAALFGLITILLVVLITWEITGNMYTSTLAGFILAGTGGFIEASRQVRLGAPVIAAILFAFYCFIKSRKDSRWLIGIFVSIAIGIMFKSVIGTLSIPIIIIWAYVVEKDFSWLKNRYLWIGALLGALILLPWHLYETLKFGDAFWNNYFIEQVVDRFEHNVNGGHSSDFEYLRDTFLYTFPWALVFFGSIVALFRKDFLAERYRPMAALILSSALIFLLFGIAKTKIFYYVLPAIVLFAISNALLFERLYQRCATKTKRVLFWAGTASLLLIGLFNSVYIGFHYEKTFHGFQSVVTDEQAIGTLLASAPPLPVRGFLYEYWDTIRYYSGEKDPITLMQDGDRADEPFYMIISAALYKTQPFPSNVMARLTPLYIGNEVNLLEFK